MNAGTAGRRRLFYLLLALDVALIVFILTRSLKPAEASDEESGGWLALLQNVLPSLTMHAVRKLAHFTEFFLLGGLLALTCRLRRGPALWLPLGVSALVACADETIQRFVPGRSGALKDVALDCAGALTAMLLVWLAVRLRRRRASKKAAS